MTLQTALDSTQCHIVMQGHKMATLAGAVIKCAGDSPRIQIAGVSDTCPLITEIRCSMCSPNPATLPQVMASNTASYTCPSVYQKTPMSRTLLLVLLHAVRYSEGTSTRLLHLCVPAAILYVFHETSSHSRLKNESEENATQPKSSIHLTHGIEISRYRVI